MIVHNEETLNQALQMLESQGSVRYSDEFAYVIITTPGTLEMQCRRAFERNSIAIVVPLGQERIMEAHSEVLKAVRKRRVEEEKKRMQKWVREHPEEVEKYKGKL